MEGYGNTKYSGGNTVEIPSGANRGGVFLHLSIMVHAAATYCSAFHPYGTRKFGDIISTIIIINTRPKPAFGRQGLDWIIGPGYSFVVFSTNKTMETN